MKQHAFNPGKRFYTSLVLASCLATLVACSGGVNSSGKFPLIVSVSGLGIHPVELTNNDGDKLIIRSNGTYQFKAFIPFGKKYAVRVALQPEGQLCTVTHGFGRGSANMPIVHVICSAITKTHVIGGTVSGLQDGEIVLKDNGTDILAITTNGPFQFRKRIANDSSYQVTIATQPPGQECVVTNAEGSHVTHDVNNIIVTCGMVKDAFTIGGTVSGLSSGTVVLNNLDINGVVVDTLSVKADYPPFPDFVFGKKVVFNGYYKVTVNQNPSGKICTVSHASGNNITKDITNVAVNCVPADNSYTISGTLSGLDPGAHITLDNDGENLPLNSNGRFIFKNPVANGGEYDVSVVGDFPFLQDCLVRNGTGEVKDEPVIDVQVFCFAAPVRAIYSFPYGEVNYYPVGLMQAQDGTFYGIATSISKDGVHSLNHKTGYIFTIANGIVTAPDDECKTPNSWCFAGAGNYWKQPPVLPTGIMQAKDGDIYGPTFLAGTTDPGFDFGGAIYKLDTSSKTLVQNDDLFQNDSDAGPIADLIQDDEGNFYGITYGNTLAEGATHGGSIFKRAFDGKIMECPDKSVAKICTLHTFGSEIHRPSGKLVLVKDELSGAPFLYGVTEKGGTKGTGAIFKFDLSRLTLEVIASFDDTAIFFPRLLEFGHLFFYNPYERAYSGLIQATDGHLYGVSKYGGKNNAGRVYKITSTPPHTFSILYEFEKSNGYPAFELVQLKDGNLYGVTQGEANSLADMGSIFRIHPDGSSFTILHTFFGNATTAGAARPSTRLVAGSDGKSLYGGTQSGGTFNQGTIYKLGRN